MLYRVGIMKGLPQIINLMFQLLKYSKRCNIHFVNIILLMKGSKNDRQRRIDNVQKELMTNYYLHKYNSLMSEITKQPQPPAQNFSSIKFKEPESSRINFKNMILLKKNQNQNYYSYRKQNTSPDRTKYIVDLQLKTNSKEEQENNRAVKKLEDSIINQLYKASPTKLEQGSYKRIQIGGSKFRNVNIRKFQLEQIPIENIEITEEEEKTNDQQHDENELREEEERNVIKERIRLQFEMRNNKSPSNRRSNSKQRDSSESSSRISMEVKIHSPKKTQRLLTPNRINSINRSINAEGKKSNSEEEHNHNESFEKNGRISEQKEQISYQPQIHFYTQFVDPVIQEFERVGNHPTEKEKEMVLEDIEFIPPTSNYYKSENSNLVEESFRFQDRIGSQRDSDSQRRKSINSSEKNPLVKQSLSKKQSRKSLKSGEKIKSEIKDSSNFEMSFVSKMSMLSAEQGHLIRDKIEKELYDNELGPYQSALYGLLDMINEFPRSGSVYAVGQKTLDDRQCYEQRSRQQYKQINQCKRGIQKLKSKAQVKHGQGEDEIIRKNKLQIMRMIRKISTKL